MLQVTQDALLFSRKILEGRQVPEDVCMRLSRNSQTRLELSPAPKQDSDQEYDLEGKTVLAVEKDLAEELSGQRLYVESSGAGEAQLRLREV